MIDLEGKVRSVLILQPRGGDYARFIQFFRENDVLGKAVNLAGAWSAEVHVPVSRSGPIVVTAIWDSAAAYEAWRTHPIRAELPPITQIAEDAESPLAISSDVFEVAIAVARE